MILAAHQPVFFPSIRVFAKLLNADVFVWVDDFQYTTHDCINRTKIKTVAGLQWLTVPVLTRNRLGQVIREVEIIPSRNWVTKHLKTLHVNYAYAAYYDMYIEYIERIYAGHHRFLLDLNMAFLTWLIEEMRVTTKVVLSSELPSRCRGQERILELLRHFDCETYLADPEYRHYLKEEAFSKCAKKLLFDEMEDPVYYQQFGTFCPGLSIIDLLFNEGPESRHILLQAAKGRELN